MRHCTYLQNFINIVLFVQKIFTWFHSLFQPCIGQSGRRIETRANEHMKQIEKNEDNNVVNTSSQFDNHILDSGHSFDPRTDRPWIYVFSEAKIKLKELKHVAILGHCNFGRVDLVCSKDLMKMKPFALKQLKKYRAVRKEEQSLAINEKNVLMKCDHPFIFRLHKSFRNEQFVYMLFEACLGGPLRKIRNKKHYFPEKTARFVVASVVEALEYLHGKHIIYRDLKPDNVVIDEKGFVKLVDFGLSKQLGYSGRTWSFCGTANNIAPEIILNVGHDRAVDYIYELLCEFTLFSDLNPMKAYAQIIEGIDKIKFSSGLIGGTAEDSVRKLCRSERLGYQRTGDIKQGRWFKGYNWSGLI